MDAFGKRERQNPDWFEEGIAELQPVITARRAALVEYKRDPQRSHLMHSGKPEMMPSRLLSTAPMNMGWTFVRVFNSPLTAATFVPCMAAWRVFGPSATKITPLKCTTGGIITDQGKQMEKWAEHCQELYSRESTVTDSTVENAHASPILEELDMSILSRQTEQGHWLPCLWQSSRKRWHPTRSHQDWQADCAPPPPPWASATSAGKRGLSPKICVMPTSSPYTRTRVTTVTATITVESPSSALLGRPLPTVQYWTGCRCLLSTFTQKCSVDLGLEDQQSTWSSHYISSKRSATSRHNLCTLHLLIWPRLLDLVR